MTPETELNTLIKSRIDGSTAVQALLPEGYITVNVAAPDNTKGPFFVFTLTDIERDGLICEATLEIYGNMQKRDATVAQQVMQEIVKLFNSKIYSGTTVTACRFWLDKDNRNPLIKKDEALQTSLVEMLLKFKCRWMDVPVLEDEIYP